MPACPTCKVRHAPYTCAQYQALRRAENAADDARSGHRRDLAAKHDEQVERRRRKGLLRWLRRRPRSI
jgi:hypothetical protein